MEWLHGKQEENYEDVIEKIQDLVHSFYGRGKERTKLDRYRDFKLVFDTDEGKRVLYEIIGWAGLYQPDLPDYGPVDVNRVLEKSGKKKIVIDILTVLMNEPKQAEKGAVQNRKG